eukprot:scaffold8253_cov267-Pinguiococcus_pyrenoidosus.AAC.2
MDRFLTGVGVRPRRNGNGCGSLLRGCGEVCFGRPAFTLAASSFARRASEASFTSASKSTMAIQSPLNTASFVR